MTMTTCTQELANMKKCESKLYIELYDLKKKRELQAMEFEKERHFWEKERHQRKRAASVGS